MLKKMSIEKRLKITNTLLFALSVLCLVSFVLPYMNILFSGSGSSFYFPPLGLMYCAEKGTDWDCRHEVGHMIEHDMGDIATTTKFSDVLLVHIVYVDLKNDNNLDDVSNAILGFPGMMIYNDMYHPYHSHAGSSPQQELYASLYANFDGDVSAMPMGFKELYSDDPKYEEIYQKVREHQLYLESGEKIWNALKEFGTRLSIMWQTTKSFIFVLVLLWLVLLSGQLSLLSYLIRDTISSLKSSPSRLKDPAMRFLELLLVLLMVAGGVALILLSTLIGCHTGVIQMC